MKQIFMQILVLFVLFISVFSQLPDNYTKTQNIKLVDNILNIGYSNNHRMLLVISSSFKNSFFVYDGLHLNNKVKITIQDEGKNGTNPSCFCFSNDNSMLIIGTKQGGIYVFKINSGSTVETNYSFFYRFGQKQQQNWVRSVELSKQNKIAVGALHSFLVLNFPEQGNQLIKQKSKDYLYIKIYSAIWSPSQSNVLFLGGVGSVGKFSKYNLQTDAQTQINKDETYTLKFLADGTTLFQGAVGKNIDVYSYKAGDQKPTLQTSINQSSDASQIITSGDNNFIGAQTLTGTVMIWKIVKSQLFVNDQSLNLQLQNQVTLDRNLKNNGFVKINSNLQDSSFNPLISNPGSNLALSYDSNNIIIISTNQIQDSAISYILCGDGTYLKDNSCIQCNKDKCKTCFDQNTCLSCQVGKFVNGDICTQCKTVLNGCLQCSDAQTCTKCNQDQKWKNQTKDGKCVCQDQYFIKDNVCSLCSKSLLDCDTCSDQNTCSACKDQNNFDPKPSDQDKCVCKPQYYLNNQKCQECQGAIKYCLKCTMDGKICQQCNDQANRQPSPDSSQCICKTHYFEDTQNKCTLCDVYQICLHCQANNPSNCTECDTSKHRESNPDNGKCLCAKGYYDDFKGNCEECSKNLLDCQQCSQDGSQCKKCKNQNNFNPVPQNGTCICNQGWILDIQTCLKCSQFIIGCKNCVDKTKCTTCDTDSFFIEVPVDDKCICQNKYWLNQTICQSCSTKINYCQVCSQTGQTCSVCQAESNRQPSPDQKSCLCVDYYYEDTDNVCKLCDPDHQSCIKCDLNKKCTKCDAKKHWKQSPTVDGKCQCQDGYNEVNGTCILCTVVGCFDCLTEKTCQSCDQNRGFQPHPINNSKCECQKGKYIDNQNQICKSCSLAILGCITCDNANDCRECDDKNHWQSTTITNKCQCKQSYYQTNQSICQSCQIPIPHCYSCFTINTNSVECSVCQKGYGTSANKKQCIDCTLASVGCINCTDTKTCTQCDTEGHFIPDTTTKGCKCVDTYFQKTGKCSLCEFSIVGCINCQNQSQCTLCNNQKGFQDTPQNGTCICQNGKTLDAGICKSCQQLIIGCLQCNDDKTCTKCDDDNNFQITDDNKCICNSKFWLNITACDKCATILPGCQTCSENGQICSSCTDQNRVVNQNKTACICKDFTYEDQDKLCKLCDDFQTCVHCKDSSFCLQCNPQKRWNEKPNDDGKCTCKDGYQQYQNVCVVCQIPGCLNCSSDNICLSCNPSKNFQPFPIDNKCECKNGTYKYEGDQSQCFQCNQKLIGCVQCENLKQCKVCDEVNHFILNQDTNQCQCNHKEGYFFNQTLQKCVLCEQTIKYCQICTITTDKQQCDECKKGFQPASDKKSCLNCQSQIIGCTDCHDMDKCKECDTQNHFVLNQEKLNCDCITGWFINPTQRKCVSCLDQITGCIDCDQDGSKCFQCDTISNFVLNDQKICQCVQGFYLLDKACAFCSTKTPGCMKCNILNGQNCTSCDQSQNFVFNNISNTCDCSEGYFIKDRQCTLCKYAIPGCIQCTQTGSECSACNQDEHFVLDSDTNTCICSQSYIFDKQNQKCVLCQDYIIGCDKCSSEGDCEQCAGDHFTLNDTTKRCDCQTGYFINAKLCSQCNIISTGCQNCSRLGQECYKCSVKDNFVLDNNTNKCICLQGYFKQKDTCVLCENKYPGCTKCSQDGSECNQCNSQHFVLNSTTKKCQCQAHYYISDKSSCTLCSQSLSNCVSCNSNVSNANSFVPYCTECQSNFDLNQGKCVQRQQSNWYIYAIIGAVVVLLGAIGGYFIFKKCKKEKLQLQSEYQALEEDRSGGRNVKPDTILTQNNTGTKMSFKSSQYSAQD